MGRFTSDAENILVLVRGSRVNSVRRIVFTGHSFPGLPGDAAGVINYRGDIAVVHRDIHGLLYIDLAEPLLRKDGPALTRRIISN
jgi:hypothetical protein